MSGDLVARAMSAFERLERAGHAAVDDRIRVQVVSGGNAGDTPTLVVVTPWMIAGLVFVPDDRFPSSLVVGGMRFPVFHDELPELGPYRSVVLTREVDHLPSSAHARKVAASFAPLLRQAVERARRELPTQMVLRPADA